MQHPVKFQEGFWSSFSKSFCRKSAFGPGRRLFETLQITAARPRLSFHQTLRFHSFLGGSEAADTPGPEPKFECLRRKICEIHTDGAVGQADLPGRGAFAEDAVFLPGSLSPGTKPSSIGEQVDRA